MSVRRRILQSLIALAGIFGTAGTLAAQDGTIVGTVRTETGEPVAGATIALRTATAGETSPAVQTTTSRPDGRFILPGVSAGEWRVSVDVIGFATASMTVTVAAGQTANAAFQLTSEAIALDEIVVTGVSGATAKAKVPFAIDQVNAEDLPVTAVSPATAIQGKVAGVTIKTGSGRPGQDASILLRAPTSINAAGRSQGPLIIVDGVILSGGLVDINGLDIQSVEVVKGAAAASLYGSRAANGVVQITTKRGRALQDDQVRYTVRSEFGMNSLPDAKIIPSSHPYKMQDGQFVEGDGDLCDFLSCESVIPAGQGAGPGELVTDWNTYMTNPWPTTYDQVDRFFQGGDRIENYISAAGRSGATNFFVSATQLHAGGIMRGFEGFNRTNFRVNLDQAVRSNLTLSASAFYSMSEQDEFPENSGNPLYRLTRVPAGVDLLACEDDPTKSCENDPENIILVTNPFNASESGNPIYEMLVHEYHQTRNRFLGSVNGRWSPTNWLALDMNASYDRLDRQEEERYPVGYRSVGNPSSLVNGNLYELNGQQERFNGSATATLSFDLTDGILNRTQLRYLYEQEDDWSSDIQGYNFSVAGLYNFDNVDQSTLDSGSGRQSIRSDGYFLITNFDIFDRYVIDALIRNDGSSLFGEDNRRAWYYRVGGAWRVGAEPWFDIPSVSEFKLRAAYGTAGNRPRFVAQYETFSVSGGVISPVTLGNAQLKPEKSSELEVGVDALFAEGRLALGLTYATTTTTDQILQVPLPAYTGYQQQYQNAGTLESNSIEASLEALLVQTEDVSWSARLLFDRSRAKITELTAPPFTQGVGGQGLGTVYFVREGEEMGTFYGAQAVTECGHLPQGTDCTLFERNDEGFLVYTGGSGFEDPQWGMTYTLPNGTVVNWGAPFRGECLDKSTGERTTFCPVGKAMPDYHMALSSTFQWKGFQLYGLLDMEQGFDVYNQTSQWAVFRTNSAICDQTGVPLEDAKPIGYCRAKYFSMGGLMPSSIFVEDGSYIKLREVSASYSFSPDVLSSIPGLGGAVSGLTLTATGRNLITWTDYTGYDPEIGKAGGDVGSAALARVDGYTYPNFRTVTLGVTLNF